MQRVVFQTWCGGNSTHPLSCIVASTRRGTTDCDYPACVKGLNSRCRDQGGHLRRHHVATAGHVWAGQGRGSSEASVEHGRSARRGLRTWLRYASTTLRGSTGLRVPPARAFDLGSSGCVEFASSVEAWKPTRL